MAEMAIITVKKQGDAATIDLELSTDLPIKKLSASIAHALNIDADAKGNLQEYDIESYPPGRILKETETLAQVQAWDGSWLVLVPKQGSSGAKNQSGHGNSFDQGNTNAPPPADIPPQVNKGNFTWKRIDSDQ